MTELLDVLFSAKAEGVREGRREQRIKPVHKGKVLSLLPSNGEWLAVVASFTSKPDEPVLSKIVPITDLKGSARRKADRWVRWLA